jgi:putative transposase
MTRTLRLAYTDAWYDAIESRRGFSNEPRNVAMYLLRRVRCDSLRQIGEQFQLRKYNSVISVTERTKILISNDLKLRVRVEKLSHDLSKSQKQT